MWPLRGAAWISGFSRPRQTSDEVTRGRSGVVNPAGRVVYIMATMNRTRLSLLALLLVGAPAYAAAQGTPPGQCALPDTVRVTGNVRVTERAILNGSGFAPRVALTPAALAKGIRDLYALGQFDDVRVTCEVAGDQTALVVTVVERPVLGTVRVQGASIVGENTLLGKVGLDTGMPLDPARVSRALARIDSIYESRGYYLAEAALDTIPLGQNRVDLEITIDEGSRLAGSGVVIEGNERIPDQEIVGAMESKPEGFLWYKRGAFDETKLAADVGQRIPALYARRGFIDAQVLQDTLIVDRERGKGLIRLTIREGEQYKVGRFDVVGNQRFSTEDVRAFYPFTDEGPTLTQRVTGFVRRRTYYEDVFDSTRWEEATQSLLTAYNNEGYISAQVNPVVERAVGSDSQPIVNLRWEVIERNPSIINRVEIVGNDYTEESCIRRQLSTVPGDVFNRDRLLRSYNQIANLGFFEAPMPPPDVEQANEEGDVDVIFRVKEKRTGNVNFGASMGQGTGIGGFIGLDQPNLFGQCKRGAVQWQFGRYINDANLSYTDPAIRESNYSGTVNVYRTQAKYNIANLGRSLRTGGSLRFGFPIPRSPFTRAFISYGGETVSFGQEGLLGQQDSLLQGGRELRSTLGLDLTRDTRIDLPFPSAGAMQTFSAQLNGGPLGGTADYQRYTGEARGYVTVAQFGGNRVGSQPMKVVMGITGRAGAVYGDPGAFFSVAQFAMGGVQFGEQLRGYPEFSITPAGFDPQGENRATRASFANVFFSTTAELGLRFNQSLYLNTFLDAGNTWREARQFNPTRLFRGAGVGVSVVTPLGPLGLDYAYGFDQYVRGVNGQIIPAPKWQFHFRLGQLF